MPNRLARESSPYLRQHADQPVDWQPWDDEALARARSEQKPIFLSIGYSTCHWCHVMAAESFADERVAAILNRDFVAVKVDREERPDLDRVYMAYVQQTTGHGGWPMSVWLTPDLKPFYGGTYFAPDDRHGRPGFATVLEAIARHWREQRPRIEQGAAEVLEILRHNASAGGGRADGDRDGGAEPLFERAGRAYEQAFQYFHEHHDQTWGGFGGAPKFPRPAVLSLLFRASVLQGRESEFGRAAEAMARHTLQRMAEGGIHDHVGGGFHRYSVDERWHVPHFEKMLYDQAQIAGNYLAAMQATGRPVFGWLARDIFTYVRRDLRAPGGAFFAAEDADSADPARPGGHAEGAFYVWSREELAEALGPRADFLCDHFGARAGGNVAHDPHGEFTGRNVLMQQQSLAQSAIRANLPLPEAEAILLECLEQLRQRRAKRPRPGRDGKVIAAWNGLMLSALAEGAMVLGEPEWLAAAAEAAGFIRRELFDERTADLRRSWCDGHASGLGFAEDYACMTQAALDLYEAGAGIEWLQWAVRLQARQDELFLDDGKGGYFSSRSDDPTVVVRMKEDHDGAEPAATSVSVMNLMRLDWLLGLPGARERAVQAVESLHHQWGRTPQALPQLLCAVELVLAEPRTAVLAGNPADPAAVRLRHVLHERSRGRRVVAYADGGAGQEWLAQHRPELAGLRPVGGRPAIYLCDHRTCRPPITNPTELAAALD